MKLITVKELSEIISIKQSTLYQWAELKQIPSVKLNGAVRFDLDDIMQWIQACKVEPQSGYNPLVQTRDPRKGGK
jgi:excisionase family DNA binding protein